MHPYIAASSMYFTLAANVLGKEGKSFRSRHGKKHELIIM